MGNDSVVNADIGLIPSIILNSVDPYDAQDSQQTCYSNWGRSIGVGIAESFLDQSLGRTSSPDMGYARISQGL